MTRLRTDQACLDAQVQAQIAQSLNAELAVPCPDCGAESGRSCRDILDRAVRTHLARLVAANRRDTEPCPPPPPTDGYWRAGIDQTESLTRASAREFYEQVCRDMAGTEKTPTAPDRAPAIAPEAVHSSAAQYGAQGEPATGPAHDATPAKAGELRGEPVAGDGRNRGENGVAAASGPNETNGRADSRPVCACGQTIWKPLAAMCADCSMQGGDISIDPPIDWKIAADRAEPDEPHHCAWSTPTSDGEGWTDSRSNKENRK
jgi:hypothetical protein